MTVSRVEGAKKKKNGTCCPRKALNQWKAETKGASPIKRGGKGSFLLENLQKLRRLGFKLRERKKNLRTRLLL